jgi:hypothetical protein
VHHNQNHEISRSHIPGLTAKCSVWVCKLFACTTFQGGLESTTCTQYILCRRCAEVCEAECKGSSTSCRTVFVLKRILQKLVTDGILEYVTLQRKSKCMRTTIFQFWESCMHASRHNNMPFCVPISQATIIFASCPSSLITFAANSGSLSAAQIKSNQIKSGVCVLYHPKRQNTSRDPLGQHMTTRSVQYRTMGM